MRVANLEHVVDDYSPDNGDKELSRWSRWLFGFAGLSLTAIGTIAVFVKETNVAGVPLLIVVGAGFLYVSLTDQRLIQVNKDGLTFSRARRLERTLDQVTTDPEISVETKERIADVAEANGITLSPPVSSVQLEAAVRAMFQSVGERHGFEVRGPGGADRGLDLLLVNGDGRQVAVAISGRLRTRSFANAIRQLRQVKVADRILVVDGGIPEVLARPFEQEHIWILNWGGEGKESLVSLLGRIGFAS